MPNPNEAGTAQTAAPSGASPQTPAPESKPESKPEAKAGQESPSNENHKPANATASEPEKKFTQADVDGIVKERLARQEKAFYKSLGVEGKEGLDSVLKNAKSDHEELVLSKNNIAQGRYEDVKIHFRGKGIELTPEALAEEVKTHPEWLEKKTESNDSSQVQPIGASKGEDKGKSEIDEINKMYGTHIGQKDFKPKI